MLRFCVQFQLLYMLKSTTLRPINTNLNIRIAAISVLLTYIETRNTEFVFVFYICYGPKLHLLQSNIIILSSTRKENGYLNFAWSKFRCLRCCGLLIQKLYIRLVRVCCESNMRRMVSNDSTKFLPVVNTVQQRPADLIPYQSLFYLFCKENKE
jgi:hypothetical protein